MALLSFFKSFTPQKNAVGQIFSVQPNPIRAHYKSIDDLRDMGARVARGEDIRLPDYEPMVFEQRTVENARLILHSYRSSDAAARKGETITPAAQWLLDNYYLVDQNIQQVERDLPKKFFRQLPPLKGKPEIPRVMALAWLYAAHTDSQFSLSSLTAVVEGFQTVSPLHIGELWALPSAVRFILIENARRLSLRVERARRMRAYANSVADEITLNADKDTLPQLLAQYTTAARDSTFATHLLYRLRGGAMHSGAAVAWLEEELEKNGSDAEDAIIQEHTRQSTGGVTMGNLIRSLKAIDDVDWITWFETVSGVDAVLREHSNFDALDFHSRNAYRVAIEKIARRSGKSEQDITQAALDLAHHSAETKGDEKSVTVQRKRDVGYYLAGDGRSELEETCGSTPTVLQRWVRFYKMLGLAGLWVPASVISIGILFLIHYWLRRYGLPSDTVLLLTILAVFPTMETANGFVNWIIPMFMPPTRLIGFEYKNGLPPEAKTLVAVPTLITSRDSVDEHIRNLEVHYLTNPRGEIYFALLTDWADSKVEQNENDLDILDYAREKVTALNQHYTQGGNPRFFLLHRKRLYNAQEGRWMGWERKRGKLHELNLLLRGDKDTTYFPSNEEVPTDIKFVMTLDSDTRLTPDSVNRLAGKLSHPLNRPIYKEKSGRVTSGYAILQPRVTPSLTTGDDASFLQRVFSVNRGIDPYVFAVSDVYQDVLGEGTFTGKGLYDIDFFELALDGKIDENTVLSHDLLEGGYARAALVSDVEVVEDYPTGYNVDISRHHRWTRGDWQLLPYLFSTKPGVTAVTRWKMTDNLRRSLTPVFWIIASIAGWTLLPPGVAALWQFFMIFSMFIVPTMILFTNLVPTDMNLSLKGHFQAILTDIFSGAADIALRITFIANMACLMADAIARTLYRVFISRKNLLEWRAAAQAKASAPDTLQYYARLMWPAVIVAIVAIALPLATHNRAWFLAVPFALIWFFSPVIAWLVSRSAKPLDDLNVRSSDKSELRRFARRTWHYYDTFVTKEQNFIPPDNFQEDPHPVIATRTSPTNIGMYLLSTVAARDFGWIGFNETLTRIDDTLTTLEKMEKYRGHLYNWYETTTLRPLLPLYVSSVDSGNLAGHLVALSSALEKWAEAPSVYLQSDLDGILDVSDILEEAINDIPDERRVLRPLRRRLDERVANFRRAITTIKEEPETASLRTINLSLFAGDIQRLTEELHGELESPLSTVANGWALLLVKTCQAHTDDAIGTHDGTDSLRERLVSLATRARQLAFDTDFTFLERKERRLLSIGFRVDTNELDASCYDLLASEARLASLFAIAKGDIPVDHWFRLGRLLVPVGWRGALISWSGSMFEYLMPPLVMIEPLGSMLDQTNKLIVQRQIEYGESKGLPWGISEAAYNARDPEMNYQYTNFGVPTLGLKRGLSKNYVVAPYASIMAAQYRPAEAVVNLKRLREMGALGQYGFYDAVDFTRSRVREDEEYAVVRNYMAHHHGMSIVAVNNVVFEGRMRDRFHSDPVIEAAELLLQEKAPREIPVLQAKADNPMRKAVESGEETASIRFIKNPLSAPRATQIMSNGHYSVMVTANGGGYSRWNGLAITRFQPDPLESGYGTFLFLRDLDSGEWWSATGDPVRAAGEKSTTIFADYKAEFVKENGTIQTTVETIVASDSDGEGRRIIITNTGTKDRIIEVTSYAELVLTADDTDTAHPAFAKMFVETEIDPRGDTIYATRRKRGSGEPDIHVAHVVTDGSGAMREIQAETDRRAFIGRGRNLRNPAAFDEGVTLNGSQGFVLDPIASLRCRVRVPAHKRVTLVYWTLVGPDRHELEEVVSRFRHPDCFAREFSLSWTSSQVRLHHIEINPDEAADFQRVATSLIYTDKALRLPSESIASGLGSQSDLWPMSISGDFPILALRIDDEADMETLKNVLKAQEYWRAKGLVVDVVVINERSFSYAQDFQRGLEAICENSRNRGGQYGPRVHIFTVRKDQMSDASYNTLLASARIVMHAQNGTLVEQLKRTEELAAADLQPAITASGKTLATGDTGLDDMRAIAPAPTQLASKRRQKTDGGDLAFWNGFGGFDMKTNEYVIRLADRANTPQPWINVISNAGFGFHVSAEGAGFTWSSNSRDYQLTQWSNDPVINRSGEAIYVVDLDKGTAFSPTASVLRDPSVQYETRHGQGYSTFLSRHGNVGLELTHTIDTEMPVRVSSLKITNNGGTAKQLRVYGFVEWMLGNSRAKTAPFIVPSHDVESGALFARNPYGADRKDHVAFFASNVKPQSVTSDRTEFFGPLGSVDQPVAVLQAKTLSNVVEAGGDPCAAMAVDLEIAAGETKEILFYIGDTAGATEARRVLSEQLKKPFEKTLAASKAIWTGFLDGLQVDTPDDAFDVMVNRWLPYQSLACRIWARTAFYQASGAFGFRDQLQDTLSMLVLDPSLARHQILNVAARQFKEGDVQHWWLPTSGAGVRTMISDDVVWLGYAIAHYTSVTGDMSILDEQIAFIEGKALENGEHDAFYQPTIAADKVTVYEHAARALDLAIARTGSHGLPLMLTGDWNDGMNRVGEEGKGESIWLGWFLISTLRDVLPIARQRKDTDRVKRWEAHIESLKAALEKDGWDGEWYRRGYFDDGSPLGSKTSEECKIDSIAQSWSVLSGYGDADRAKQAMQSVATHLVDDEVDIIKLFTPPFNKSRHDPGYIKSYPPGVRENGGQYTHAATWAVLAMAKLGNADEAYRWFSKLNPVNHSLDADKAESYRVEPYVVAADVYSVDPMRGRGGWTWYTGSAGWLYRVATEGILGISRQNDRLFVDPALPTAWTDGFSFVLRNGKARYTVEVKPAAKGGRKITVDGKKLAKADAGIPLETSGEHKVLVEVVPGK
ncbi:glucoamylase family protein [Phyllobacterium sp. P30BS-XVII]|uniref:GH36-type glycosyl hydrolase domain-containing protein n=1 Tax=Phyllobacterium sp. P30BS-XVII TaxID=2587046 RepID=UPI0015FAC14E|nr:glucoamylase family protein [Phyllobacterium sp. P30BS-XVII]MBA8899432.1 cyclic beta-1,2-glucan synthetase [Phyllobacterium sp. P30BS-XVII]